MIRTVTDTPTTDIGSYDRVRGGFPITVGFTRSGRLVSRSSASTTGVGRPPAPAAAASAVVGPPAGPDHSSAEADQAVGQRAELQGIEGLLARIGAGPARDAVDDSVVRDHLRVEPATAGSPLVHDEIEVCLAVGPVDLWPCHWSIFGEILPHSRFAVSGVT